MEQVPEHLRGTYAGLASEEAISYLSELGVTAVELLPVHHFADESFLADRGLSNYWGYSSIGFLAPHALYSASGTRGEQVSEFKGMVKALHRAGIEVILDVVYNHTAEGNHQGPMLSFKGIDNATYYRPSPEARRYYMDFTGTGNTLDPTHPSVLRLIMDSLRYFATECHVDGFRFDLAPTLARTFYEVDRLSSFLDAIHQDPVLSRLKLIAEPWDVGPGGYQVGNFPVLWREWNAEYRDTIRDFWRGEASLAAFAGRFTGSEDLYGDDGRRPLASINFVTAHDGFTLNDLVSYNEKHNEANLEDNRDGNDQNRSWNCGVEGPTDDPEILDLSARQRRNLLTTLLLSQGVPMITGGDEIARTQGGNNNGWCQDNEISWLDWENADDDLRAFTQRLIELRRTEPVFRRSEFLQGDRTDSGVADVGWLRPDGEAMTDEDWAREDTRALAVFLNGREIDEQDRQGPRDPRALLPAARQRPPRAGERSPSRRPQAKRAGPPNCRPSLPSRPTKARCPPATRWSFPTGRWSFSAAAKTATCMCGHASYVKPNPNSARGSTPTNIRLRYSWRSRESPISQIRGGHKPTKRARRSALPRSSWSTVLARIHNAMQSATEPSEKYCMCAGRNPKSWRRFVNMERVCVRCLQGSLAASFGRPYHGSHGSEHAARRPNG